MGVPCPGPIQEEWVGWGGDRVEVGWCGGRCGVGQGVPYPGPGRGNRPGWRCGGVGWGTLSWSCQVPSPLLLWMDKQSENITFPRISYVGSKIEMK